LQDVLTNPLISGLKADLSRSEARVQELSSRLGDRHPLLVEARANTAELRARIEAETRRVTSGVGVTNTINRQREAEIRATFEAQRQKVLRMKEQRDEVAVLQREVDNAQKAYDAVVARFNQASLESQVTQTNVALLTPAVEPTRPSSPNVVLNVAAASVLGSILAVSLALVLEIINRRVRSVDDLRVTLGIPVLGLLPGPAPAGAFGQSAKPLLARRVLGQLPMHGTKGR
jgi:succinoglycan biosynthesis transport protein ExoP